MKYLQTFERFFTVEKPKMISQVVEDSNGWVVIRIEDASAAINPEFEAKFMNYWQPEKIDAIHYAVEVGDLAGLEELRHFLNTTLGKFNYKIVEEHFDEYEELEDEL